MVRPAKPLGGLIGLAILLILMTAAPGIAAGKPVVGVIMTGGIPYYDAIHEAFVTTLAQKSYSERIELTVQKPAPGYMSWHNAARRFEVLEVDVIVVYGTPAALAVRKEVSKIPVVYAAVSDPEGVGLTGSNITGVRTELPVASMIRYLRSLSEFKSLGVIYSSAEPDTVRQVALVETQAEKLNFGSIKYDVKADCAGFQLPGVDALLMTTSTVAAKCVHRIIETTRAARIPSAALLCGFEHQGVIFTVCGSPQFQGKHVAEAVIAIMNGSPPSAIKVRKLRQNEMIINVKEAQNLDINIPIELLMSATQLIKE